MDAEKRAAIQEGATRNTGMKMGSADVSEEPAAARSPFGVPASAGPAFAPLRRGEPGNTLKRGHQTRLASAAQSRSAGARRQIKKRGKLFRAEILRAGRAERRPGRS